MGIVIINNMADTQQQKEKKNHRRLKKETLAYYPSIQRNYSKPKTKIINNEGQLKLV